MTEEQRAWLIGGIFIAVMIIIFIPFIIRDYKKNKDKYVMTPEKKRKMEEEILNREAEIVTFDAEIANMICGTGMVGSYRLPKSVKTFLIIFKKDNEDIVEVPVSEEIYLSLEIGMRGSLTLLDGKLDSFELFDEEVITEEN